jgi:transcriptional regulator with XRE-family HTH domain
MSKIAGRIKAIRKELKLSQAEMARRVGIHVQTLSKYERGEQIPSVDTVIDISQKLDVNLNYLILGQEPMLRRSEDILNIPGTRSVIERIKKILHLSRINDVADKLGVSPSELEIWKQTGRFPIEPLVNFSRRYGVKLDRLLYGMGGESSMVEEDVVIRKVVSLLKQLPDDAKKHVLRYVEREVLLNRRLLGRGDEPKN